MNDSVVLIKSVWKDNRQHENSIIRSHIFTHSFISLSTKNLGYRDKIPAKASTAVPDSNHARVQMVVKTFPLVQVGLALFDESGNLPTCQETGRPCVWEFNLSADGRGIYPADFVIGLFATGSLKRSRFRWVVFKGGLDFACLLKMFTGEELPRRRADFLRMVKVFFPSFYDVMQLVAMTDGVSKARGKLDRVAKAMHVDREFGGPEPRGGAASDCLLGLRLFMKVKTERYGGQLPEAHANVIFGF